METRRQIGLQFFAEEAAEAAGTAEEESGNDSFLEGFEEEAYAFDMEDAGTAAAPETQQAPPAEEPPAAQAEQQPEDVPEGAGQAQAERGAMQSNTQEEVQIPFGNAALRLPKTAVDALSGALGVNAAEIIRRGLDYDNKGARESALLARLAEVSGKDLPTFMQEAERQMLDMQIEREMQNVRAKLPEDTPDEAVRQIAQRNVTDANNRRAFQAYQARQAQMQRARQAQAQAVDSKVQPWRDYIKAFGVTKMEDIPQEVLNYANQGMDPIAAHYRVMAEQAQQQLQGIQQAQKQNAHNRQAAAGSMQSMGGDEKDAFLSGLLADE